ncbi:hypothetical protein Fmac_020220 [Flemingia macrophylla]|uniref:FCP1 homology domain-containing protein n=1 Tax=Flemingia macrophylla TaxID=520843 RepID=A0ABD1LU22_9FABA
MKIEDKAPMDDLPSFVDGNCENDGVGIVDVAPPLLPPSLSRRDTVFLDLDETLVHSQFLLESERVDFVVRPVIDGEPMEPSDDAGSAYEHERVGGDYDTGRSGWNLQLCGFFHQ